MALSPYFISKMHHVENLKNSFCVKKKLLYESLIFK